MATENSGDDAKTLDNAIDHAQNGSKATVAKSNTSRSNEDEIRTRAYEIFKARNGGPGSELDDWQKADSSFATGASKADAPQGVQPPVGKGSVDSATGDADDGSLSGLTKEEADVRLKKFGPN